MLAGSYKYGFVGIRWPDFVSMYGVPTEGCANNLKIRLVLFNKLAQFGIGVRSG